MISKIKILIVVISIFLTGCNQNDNLIEREKVVYKTLLESFGLDESSHLMVKSMSVMEYTNFKSREADFKESEAYNSYIQLNKIPSKSTIDKNSFKNLSLLSNDDLDNIFQYSDLDFSWNVFRQNHPKASGIFGFSKVGFNKKGDVAVMYYTFSCGSRCGHGAIIQLNKEASGWKIHKRKELWIS